MSSLTFQRTQQAPRKGETKFAEKIKSYFSPFAN